MGKRERLTVSDCCITCSHGSPSHDELGLRFPLCLTEVGVKFYLWADRPKRNMPT